MEIMVMDFVEAAKVRGEGYRWIIFKEIWPNAAMPLISDFGLRFIYVILFVSSLSFLGLGVQPPGRTELSGSLSGATASWLGAVLRRGGRAGDPARDHRGDTGH